MTRAVHVHLVFLGSSPKSSRVTAKIFSSLLLFGGSMSKRFTFFINVTAFSTPASWRSHTQRANKAAGKKTRCLFYVWHLIMWVIRREFTMRKKSDTQLYMKLVFHQKKGHNYHVESIKFNGRCIKWHKTLHQWQSSEEMTKSTHGPSHSVAPYVLSSRVKWFLEHRPHQSLITCECDSFIFIQQCRHTCCTSPVRGWTLTHQEHIGAPRNLNYLNWSI